MSENVEIIRRGYDLWNRGDMDAFLDQYSSDATPYPLSDFADTQIRHAFLHALDLAWRQGDPH